MGAMAALQNETNRKLTKVLGIYTIDCCYKNLAVGAGNMYAVSGRYTRTNLLTEEHTVLKSTFRCNSLLELKLGSTCELLFLSLSPLL